MAREIFRVVPHGSSWLVKRNGQQTSSHSVRDQAIATAKDDAKWYQPSKLVVHRTDGTIEFEWDFGSDESQAT
jgi:hypothetical protein